jgi:predicted DNA-binding transcriptional regulator AlpA
MNTSADQILTRRELARHFKVSVSSVKRWEASGRLSPLKIGPRLVRYRLSDVIAFAERRAKKTA